MPTPLRASGASSAGCSSLRVSAPGRWHCPRLSGDHSEQFRRTVRRRRITTILIVDDLAANRTLLVSLLAREGHRMLEAANGSQGLAAVRAEHPDLVIADVLMPVMDGYEFTRQLRLDPAIRTTPVVFITAHYSADDARALARALGVTDVLLKPADIAEVLRVVRRALAGAMERPIAPGPPPLTVGSEHLRLVTDKLSEQSDDLRSANTRLRSLINVGLELASERDPGRLLSRVCEAARELVGATYVTLGIVDLADRTVQSVTACGTDNTHWIKVGDPISGILATVIAERRTARGTNPADPAGSHFPPLHPDVRAYLAAPIASPANVFGWFCLVGNEDREFTDEDESLTIALAGQVGRIFESSHFHAVAQQRTESLEREIVERQQVEADLRRERDRTRRYMDTAEVMLLALDLEGRITLVNRFAAELLGWPAGELLGRDWIETCLPARIREVFRKRFAGLVAGDFSISENAVLTRSGDERLIEWRNTVLKGDDGEVVGTFSSGADITERDRAVEALRTAEERMRFALEASGVGIWDLNFATGTLEGSAILESQHGLQPGTFGGSLDAFLDRVHPDDRDALIEALTEAKRSGTDFTVQHRIIRPDGTVRWLSGAGRMQLDERGEPLRAVGISLDVTAHRELEEQYRQAQKLEAVGRLAGGVAHDFNNLLTAILLNCELLLAGLAPDDPRRAGIAEVQQAGESGAALTRQLLAFSRKQIIEPTLLDLNVVVTAMQTMLGRLIREDVTVVHHLRPGLAAVLADHGQVEQIVMNLAMNAQDAMPDGGILTIETRNLDCDADYAKTHADLKPGAYVVLTVSDTGTGMTPEVQSHLFEPFFTTKEPGKGTGLGLATVHGIVIGSGGSVQAYSEVGHGTAFKVYFPKADGAIILAEVPRDAATPPTGTETVLLVEDSERLRELTRRVLARLGYSVLVAANEAEARRLFAANPSIAVVLTDVVMPGASGPELARQLVEQRPALRVLYMSGYTEDAIIHHGVLNPGIAFLHKPFTMDSLGRKLREVLDR